MAETSGPSGPCTAPRRRCCPAWPWIPTAWAPPRPDACQPRACRGHCRPGSTWPASTFIRTRVSVPCSALRRLALVFPGSRGGSPGKLPSAGARRRGQPRFPGHGNPWVPRHPPNPAGTRAPADLGAARAGSDPFPAPAACTWENLGCSFQKSGREKTPKQVPILGETCVPELETFFGESPPRCARSPGSAPSAATRGEPGCKSPVARVREDRGSSPGSLSPVGGRAPGAAFSPRSSHFCSWSATPTRDPWFPGPRCCAVQPGCGRHPELGERSGPGAGGGGEALGLASNRGRRWPRKPAAVCAISPEGLPGRGGPRRLTRSVFAAAAARVGRQSRGPATLPGGRPLQYSSLGFCFY